MAHYDILGGDTGGRYAARDVPKWSPPKAHCRHTVKKVPSHTAKIRPEIDLNQCKRGEVQAEFFH
jgi:hypothetical protein